MGFILGAFILLLLTTSTVYAQSAWVDARQRWTSTGIYLEQGQRFTIRAWGEAAIDTDGAYASPQGSGRGYASSRALLPGVPVHGLVCRIGGGHPFFVGMESSVRASNSGELYCGMNEDPAQPSSYADNSGGWNVEVNSAYGGYGPSILGSASVYARQRWTSTNIYVEQGRQITIRASGQAAIDTDGAYASPDGSGRGYGSPRALLPGAPLHGLVCRIGAGRPFFVGVETAIQAPFSGELSCGMNEDPAQPSSYADNSGEWTIEVSSSP